MRENNVEEVQEFRYLRSHKVRKIDGKSLKYIKQIISQEKQASIKTYYAMLEKC